MAFMKKFFLLLKIFEKVEKAGIISTKFSFRCTPSVILGIGPSFFHQTIHILRLVTLVSLFDVLPHALVLFELIIFVPSIKKSKKVNLK